MMPASEPPVVLLARSIRVCDISVKPKEEAKMNKSRLFNSCVLLAAVTLSGCVRGGTDDAKFAPTVTGKWRMIDGDKTLQFQPEATNDRPGSANVSGKEYQYEFPDDTHLRFFTHSKSLVYQFQISGNQLILQPRNGEAEHYNKMR